MIVKIKSEPLNMAQNTPKDILNDTLRVEDATGDLFDAVVQKAPAKRGRTQKGAQSKAKNSSDLAPYSTIESFLKLCDIQETALSLAPKPDFTAALKSEELKGKLYGLYNDKKGADDKQPLPCLLVEFVETPVDDLNKAMEGANGQ